MRGTYAVVPSHAVLQLRVLGFSWPQIGRLLFLRRRYQRGDFRELTYENKRMLFAQWRYEHGYLSDDLSRVRPPLDRQ